MLFVQVTLACDVSKSHDEDSYEMEEEGGVYLRELYLYGADWDTENNCLTDTLYVYYLADQWQIS